MLPSTLTFLQLESSQLKISVECTDLSDRAAFLNSPDPQINTRLRDAQRRCYLLQSLLVVQHGTDIPVYQLRIGPCPVVRVLGPWHPFLACLGFRNMCCPCIFCLDQISTDCLSLEPFVVSVEEDDVETSHTTAEASQHQYWSCERDTLLGSESKTPHGNRNIQVNSPERHALTSSQGIPLRTGCRPQWDITSLVTDKSFFT